MLEMLAMLASGDICQGDAEMGTVSLGTDTLNPCGGGYWQQPFTWTISGTLKDYQEYYLEIATNVTGSNWSFLARTSNQSYTYTDTNLGSTGGGAFVPHYARLRVSIVPKNGLRKCSTATSSLTEQYGYECS